MRFQSRDSPVSTVPPPSSWTSREWRQVSLESAYSRRETAARAQILGSGSRDMTCGERTRSTTLHRRCAPTRPEAKENRRESCATMGSKAEGGEPRLSRCHPRSSVRLRSPHHDRAVQLSLLAVHYLAHHHGHSHTRWVLHPVGKGRAQGQKMFMSRLVRCKRYAGPSGAIPPLYKHFPFFRENLWENGTTTEHGFPHSRGPHRLQFTAAHRDKRPSDRFGARSINVDFDRQEGSSATERSHGGEIGRGRT